jgi:hypothetical protein
MTTKNLIAPDSNFLGVWSMIITIITLYNFIMIPIRVAFYYHHDMSYLFVIDYMGDLILVLDILLRAFYITYYDKKGELVMYRRTIRSRYFHEGHAKLHLLASFPFDFIIFWGPLRQCHMSYVQTLSFYRLNRLVRLFDFNNQIIKMEKLFTKKLSKFSFLSTNVLQICNLLLVICATAHISGEYLL